MSDTLTTNARAKVKNTMSDCHWYFARLGWYYLRSNFGGVPCGERFTRIEQHLEKAFPTRDSWPDGMLQVWLYRKWCAGVLCGAIEVQGATIHTRERYIAGVVTEIWNFLHQFDTQLLEHDRQSKTHPVDRWFTDGLFPQGGRQGYQQKRLDSR